MVPIMAMQYGIVKIINNIIKYINYEDKEFIGFLVLRDIVCFL